MKYVVVTGGVVSGLGKGVTASSIGVLLKACGLRITSIKIGFIFVSFTLFFGFPSLLHVVVYMEKLLFVSCFTDSWGPIFSDLKRI